MLAPVAYERACITPLASLGSEKHTLSWIWEGDDQRRERVEGPGQVGGIFRPDVGEGKRGQD